MPYDPEQHHRRSIRLPDYDYAQPGGYVVTICVQGHVRLFGEVVEGRMFLNPAGQMVHAVWNDVSRRFPRAETDAFIVMPNHVHGIVVLTGRSAPANPAVGASLVGAQNADAQPTDADAPNAPPSSGRAPTRGAPTSSPSLGDVVGGFKSITTVQYTRGVTNDGWPRFNKHLWQRNYYEHVLRERRDLDRTRRYVAENPARWGNDRYYVTR